LNSFPAGSRYGTLLHDLLEWQAQHGWPAANEEWQTLLARQSERLNLLPEHSAMLDGWISTVIKKKLPLAPIKQAQEAIELEAIQAKDMWPEMGFSLPVQALGSQQLDQLISQHIWPQQPRIRLERRQLEGMLTGFMDLVLLFEGRYYVLDYKSNRLPDYSAPSLQQAMLAHRYDVQASLYLLALHRLLKSRLHGYRYEQHIGGALYLFLRGVDQPGCGMLHLSAPGGLVEGLDEAFARGQAGDEMR
jgi:exodeoxyribonuclease V beta subunit